ncbi:MAG: hypothetical protein WBF17_16590, partial [Phycisphaerae bacterium]
PDTDRGPVGVVCNVKVISDKVEDVSSLDAWRKSWIKPGMTDEDKALAIWKTVVKYRHQNPPPNELLQNERNVHDVMKTIHVYGYGMCCCAAANVEQLARHIGFDARGWAITVHSVPEVFYGGRWHLLDGSLMNYFRAPDGALASVEQISKAVMDWHEANPGYRNNAGKLRAFARNGNWKKEGPALLATCPYYTKDGPNPAGWHGWSSTMIEYDSKVSKHHVYEYGYSQGYRLNVQLRPGQRLIRNWFNKGLHVNMDGAGGAPNVLKKRRGLGLQREFGDIAPGRVGNGTLTYQVPLADGALASGALAVENLTAKSDGSSVTVLRVRDAAKPGSLILRMPSSYVYLGGDVVLDATVGSGGSISVSFSDNHGLDWKKLAEIAAGGERKVDLKPHCYRRYDYRLKLEFKGAGTGLRNLRIAHDIQHSQAPLPALGQGENTITFSAGPPEGTVTIEGATDPARRPRQLIAADFHPEFEGAGERFFRVKEYGPGGGSVTFPVRTPGDIIRIRAGAHYRARDKREGWRIQASFDNGKTFGEIGALPGPTPGSSKYFTLDKVPKGVRHALIRFQSTRQYNTLCIFDFRIDADYAEPHGGFRPVKVTYAWEEAGVEKHDAHIAQAPNETYTITCKRPPLMKSLVVELAE